MDFYAVDNYYGSYYGEITEGDSMHACTISSMVVTSHCNGNDHYFVQIHNYSAMIFQVFQKIFLL